MQVLKCIELICNKDLPFAEINLVALIMAYRYRHGWLALTIQDHNAPTTNEKFKSFGFEHGNCEDKI